LGVNVEFGDSIIRNLRETAGEGEFGEDWGEIGDIRNNCRNERMLIGSIRRDETGKLLNPRMPLWEKTLDSVKAESGAEKRGHRAKVCENMIVHTKKFRIVSGGRN
jgi:hypothetical protein